MLVLQIRVKTETHCASYIADLNVDRTDELENDRQFSVYNKFKGVKLSLQIPFSK